MMVFGVRQYGIVDNVPGLFYVATQFFHVNFIPLIPIKSHLIVAGSEKGDDFSGTPISMSGASVAMAYFRLILIVFGVLLIIGGFDMTKKLLEGKPNKDDPHGGGLIVLA